MNIIPKPQKAQLLQGKTAYNRNTEVKGDFEDSIEYAKQLLADKKDGEKSILVMEKRAGIAEEGYVIDVEKSKINVFASTEKGAFYALMTLEQIEDGGFVPCVHIEDAPKYSFRGFMLDSARHFWDTDTVKRYIDVMARLKMNVFHMHLSDDQGWRVEIKKYPLLTQKGSIRKNTQLSLKGYNSGKEAHDDKEYGRGCYYTQDQLKDLVAYAKKRHIDIMPEIDMPGHMVAAIACYPELSCTGENTEVSTRWGVMDNICCCGKDNVYNFAKDVIDELCEIFPFEFFHIGGDEVPKTRWKKCPACQKKIKELGLKDENALQGHFNNEIAKYLKSKGKRMTGWNEILDASDIMDKDIVAQWWVKRLSDRQEHAWIANGGSIIMSLCNYIYMDHPYHVRPLKKTYSFGEEVLGIKHGEKVLGAEIPQWTEYIPCVKKLDMLTAARLVAFSEVCWTQDIQKDYRDFESRMESLRPYFEEHGCRICPQYLYRGKVKPWYAFTDELKWMLWHKDVNYEWNKVKDKI